MHLKKICLALSWMTLTGVAQEPASRQGSGTVNGRVIAGDTQLPARFAHVSLFGIPAVVTPFKAPDPNASEDAQVAAMKTAMENIGKTNMVNVTTDTEGNYTATDVPPGDYYVFATASGYVAPLSQVQALVDAGADLSKPLPGVQALHVTADHSVTADATMTRGAAISGTVAWEDGSPVAGAVMTAQPGKGGTPHPPTQFAMLAMANPLGGLSITDDLGHFRLAGLAPGAYVVTATIPSTGQSGLGAAGNLRRQIASASPLIVFAPDAFHKADAKAVTITRGEDHRDVDLTLRLGGLHTISGRVSSIEDRHGINAGSVALTDAKDPEFKRAASLDAMGNYTLHFVPAGTYTVQVNDAEDTEPGKPKANPGLFGPAEKTVHSYVTAKRTVVVMDANLNGQDFDLALDKTAKPASDPSKVLGGLFGGSDPK